MISVGASRPFLTSSPTSCKSKVRANKRRTNGRGCLTQTVRIDSRWTPRLAIPPRARTRPHRDRGNRFGHRRRAPRGPTRNRRPRAWPPPPEPERAPTAIAEIDSAIGGLPRGCLTEIVGPASSGRTSLLLGVLAAATAREEACALLDAEDAFSPHSAADPGVQLGRLLWVCCGHSAEHALKAADLLI